MADVMGCTSAIAAFNEREREVDQGPVPLIPLIEYIDYYNNDRIKLRLNGMSPVKYRETYQASVNV